MENLLKETLEVLKENGKTPEDVEWVGCKEFWFTWKDFEEVANVEYYNSYGAAEVAEDLIVVGNNWWLERHEYDGAEWWEYKEPPKKPKRYLKPKKVVADINDYVTTMIELNLSPAEAKELLEKESQNEKL